MPSYISMLRGVNVSGKNKIPMVELKVMYELLGFKDVKTFIQSGNVVFTSDETDTEKLEKILEKKVLDRFGFDISVFVKTPNYLVNVIEKNPFAKENSEKLHVTFLSSVPDKDKLDKLKSFNFPPDQIVFLGKEVYVFCPDGYGKTKFNNNFFENKLKVNATTRNWKSVNELKNLAANLINHK